MLTLFQSVHSMQEGHVVGQREGKNTKSGQCISGMDTRLYWWRPDMHNLNLFFVPNTQGLFVVPK